MKRSIYSQTAVCGTLLVAGLALPLLPVHAGPSSKDEIVKRYVETCPGGQAGDGGCEKLKKEAVEILKDDLLTLGSSANRAYLMSILPVFAREEPELRIAAADALGMIGPQDGDAELLAPLANDPVPDVRRAVWQMLSHGKGNAIRLLGERVQSPRTGLSPETPPDAAKFGLSVAPGSTYLFYGSDPALGRLSYTVTGANETAAFFKAKAKKGPYKLEEFQELFRYALRDEEHAMDQALNAAAKQLQDIKPPDPTNAQVFMAHMEKLQSAQVAQTVRRLLDTYPPRIFTSPTVYVLEERQIGPRSYPTRYVVLYQDHALKQPGYRLSWMTVSDEAIKAVQVATLKDEQEELAHKKAREVQRKQAEEIQSLQKKKEEQERKQFKKGQEDLEKALGF